MTFGFEVLVQEVMAAINHVAAGRGRMCLP